MRNNTFILATDLDGTFLGGSDTERARFYSWIENSRADIGLIFVTGRDLPFIEKLCETTPVPWPDYVVGDVGTTVGIVQETPRPDGRRIVSLEPLEQDIAARWNDSGDKVRAALADADGLRLQETPFRYRVSYHYDPESYDPRAETVIREMGLDVLISANQYFDVLPAGVSKGPTLLRLVEHLAVDQDKVLVAGDTLNDLSLFETGLKGVAVGNSEPPLVAHLHKHPATYHAQGHGTAGIAEAIRHLDLFSA